MIYECFCDVRVLYSLLGHIYIKQPLIMSSKRDFSLMVIHTTTLTFIMEGWLKNLLLATSVLSCLSIVSPALAAPSTPRYSHDHLFNLSQSFTEGDKTRHKRDNVALRILSLGASIMSGTGSSTGNGYVIST